MKKHLLMALMLGLLTPLVAENLTICQLFEKLVNHATDFKPLMAGKNPSIPLTTLSTIQLEGAESSLFKEGLRQVTFEAKLGSYATRLEATAKQTEWMKALRVCFPIMKFDVKRQEIAGHSFQYAYPHLRNETTIRVFEAAFVIKKVFSTHDLSFEFPQAQEGGPLQKEIPTYTDYTILTEDREASVFAETLQEVMSHASNGFEAISGDFETYETVGRYGATLKLPGYDNCYLEESLDRVCSYVVSICKGVDQATFEAKVGSFNQQLRASLGKRFAFAPSKDGHKVHYIKCDSPNTIVASLAYTEQNGLFTAYFIMPQVD